MSRAYNFSPGPSALPEPVLRQAQADMLEFGGSGASIVELSHRGPEFLAVAHQTEADLRTLLAIPDEVLRQGRIEPCRVCVLPLYAAIVPEPWRATV